MSLTPHDPSTTQAADDAGDNDSMTDAPASFDSLDELHISGHPVLKSKLSRMRDRRTPSSEFRRLAKEVSNLLAYEASRSLQTIEVDGLSSPVSTFLGTCIQPRIALAPILRAGIGMTESFLNLFPEASTFYLGLFREKVSLQPVEYYMKLPPKPNVEIVFLLDPILATGGTAVAAINMIVDWGIPLSNIRLVSILASMPGLQNVLRSCPGVQVYCGAVDQELTPEGMIKPGLGDSGDRLFNTA